MKEKRFLKKLDDLLSCNGGKQPTIQIYDLWANEFNSEFGGVPAHGVTLYQKKERMKKIYRRWKVCNFTPALDMIRSPIELFARMMHGIVLSK